MGGRGNAPHGDLELLGVDGTAAIGVEEVEGLADLLLLFLGQALGAGAGLLVTAGSGHHLPVALRAECGGLHTRYAKMLNDNARNDPRYNPQPDNFLLRIINLQLGHGKRALPRSESRHNLFKLLRDCSYTPSGF